MQKKSGLAEWEREKEKEGEGDEDVQIIPYTDEWLNYILLALNSKSIPATYFINFSSLKKNYILQYAMCMIA